MKLKTLKNEITIDFLPEGMPGENSIKQAINETVRDLNNDSVLQRLFLTITGTETDSNVDDIKINVDDMDVNVDDMDVNVGDVGDFKSGFEWDSTNLILTIPDNIIKIDDIYLNDVKQVPMAYSRMLNSYTSEEDWTYLTYGVHTGGSAYGYTCVGNTIHFNQDITLGIVKIVVYKEYDELNADGVLSVPDYFKQYIISNSVVILSTRPDMIIGQNALERHILKRDKALLGIQQRQVNQEHTAGLDIY